VSVTQAEKAARFLALHEAPGIFLIPNPWDVGSACLLAGLGFQALATSSAASAGVLGKRDGELTRDEALAHARSILEATELPVSADLEKGFGDAPECLAETVQLAAGVGLVGCTIEDATGDPDRPLYDLSLAVERIAAASEAARALPFPFLLTARAHNLLYPGASLDETIRRLQAYEQAGAGVLFAPALPDLAAVRAVCSAVSKPFNFMAGIQGKSFSVADLAAAGVKRISLATSLYRAAMTGLLAAAREVIDTGQFTFLDRCVTSTAELNQLMKRTQPVGARDGRPALPRRPGLSASRPEPIGFLRRPPSRDVERKSLQSMDLNHHELGSFVVEALIGSSPR
jgi:2-methylisocitrate lyase-like PEP mutase family enzyme